MPLTSSRSIARIVGPTLIVMVTSELKIWNPTLYDTQIVPLVYLSGVLLFIGGLSIVLKHNVWARAWQTVLTLVGWLGLLLGMLRMFFPQMYHSQFKNDDVALVIELILIALGVFLSYKGYLAKEKKA